MSWTFEEQAKWALERLGFEEPLIDRLVTDAPSKEERFWDSAVHMLVELLTQASKSNDD